MCWRQRVTWTCILQLFSFFTAAHELVLSWLESVDLLVGDEIESSLDIFYLVDKDGNIHSREFFAEELVDDDTKNLEASFEGKSRLEKIQRLNTYSSFEGL